ncbi:MAG: PHD/YefM family antitoxin component YafN of YafNO toxin-antitoxin module [Spirosomataceae bacterium]|jgi:PHD/YefM family antitoxin component YafN of YafNO toxin-antitoxin module
MIAANDLKTKGVKVFDEALEHYDEVAITVRGKVKYVVMKVEKYDEMREAELDYALAEVKQDIKDGNYVIETAAEHVKRLWND